MAAWVQKVVRVLAKEAVQDLKRSIELEPNNTQVRQNYELFKEINDRTSQGKEK